MCQKSVDALHLHGQLLLDKDIPITTVLFITSLQNLQRGACFVMIHEIQNKQIFL